MPILLAENTVVAERYKLTRIIGRGGMGTVWQATNVRLDVPCAIKFIEGELAGDVVALARFEREAKAAAQIRSAHVVQILDHGTFHGTPYIAMELLEGEDLGRRLGRSHRMSPHDVAAIVTHVSRALSKAHAMEIVHRDLKPENVFLALDDDRELAKVLDFGIAKRVQVDAPNPTAAGTMLGTPSYMSPEQAQGAQFVDYRSDLWALAVIAFRCVTGVLPFRGDSLPELLVRIVVSPLPVPSSLAVDVPRGFDAWWDRAAARDANRRFQSARELAHALTTALGVPPLNDGLERRPRDAGSLPNERPGGLPPVPRAPAPVARPRAESVSAAPATPAPYSPREAPAATFTATAANRSPAPTLIATAIALLVIGGIAAFMVSRSSSQPSGNATPAPEVIGVDETPSPTASSSPPGPPSAAASGSGRPAGPRAPRALH
jgi:serine/threonine-protein kinase